MLFIILAGVFGGLKLDEKLNSEPAFIIIGSLLGVGSALYFVFKDLTKNI
jgi:F0F1-type ATP synthase assembly protein I